MFVYNQQLWNTVRYITGCFSASFFSRIALASCLGERMWRKYPQINYTFSLSDYYRPKTWCLYLATEYTYSSERTECRQSPRSPAQVAHRKGRALLPPTPWSVPPAAPQADHRTGAPDISAEGWWPFILAALTLPCRALSAPPAVHIGTITYTPSAWHWQKKLNAYRMVETLIHKGSGNLTRENLSEATVSLCQQLKERFSPCHVPVSLQGPGCIACVAQH